jgi:DNA-binding response OmpR family regulator
MAKNQPHVLARHLEPGLLTEFKLMTPAHILLVAPTSDLADTAVRCLLNEAQKVKVVQDFGAAKAELDREPAALVVTELKLGPYNGLHLALRANATHTPVIVLGTDDPVLETVARENGVDYLLPLEFDRLQSLAHSLMAAHADSNETLQEVPKTDPMTWWPVASGKGREPAYSRHAFVA